MQSAKLIGEPIKSTDEQALCITPGAVPLPQVLQIGRVKKIVKQGTDVMAVSNDANYAIARATVCPKPYISELLAEKKRPRRGARKVCHIVQ